MDKRPIEREEERIPGASVAENARAPVRARTAEAKKPTAGGTYEPAPAIAEAPLIPRMQSGGGRRPPIGVITWLALAVVPFLVSLFYFNFIASPQYVAEARFAVRSLSDPSSGQGLLPHGGGKGLLSMSSMTQDAYVVASFIHSTEILRRLEEKVDLRAYFDRPGIDFLSRLAPEAPLESFLAYWKQQVSVYIDGPSGLITLKVRAFTPEAAKKLADMITAASETMVNELSARARKDVIARAQAGMDAAEAQYRQALSRLNAYRNSSGILNPKAQAGETGALLTRLMGEKLQIDSRLFVLRQSDVDDSPAVQQLKRKEESLTRQIGGLRGELAATTTRNENLSKALKRFSELETERTLAREVYEGASRNLAGARAEALRKSIYVTVFDPPVVPQASLYPRTFATPFLILLGLSVAWAVGALAWASVEDHRL